jgi:hypothetical protein
MIISLDLTIFLFLNSEQNNNLRGLARKERPAKVKKEKQAKVDLCHYSEEEDTFVKISVPLKAANKHMSKHAADLAVPVQGEVAEIADPAAEEGAIICLDSGCAKVECPAEEEELP